MGHLSWEWNCLRCWNKKSARGRPAENLWPCHSFVYYKLDRVFNVVQIYVNFCIPRPFFFLYKSGRYVGVNSKTTHFLCVVLGWLGCTCRILTRYAYHVPIKYTKNLPRVVLICNQGFFFLFLFWSNVQLVSLVAFVQDLNRKENIPDQDFSDLCYIVCFSREGKQWELVRPIVKRVRTQACFMYFVNKRWLINWTL